MRLCQHDAEKVKEVSTSARAMGVGYPRLILA